MGKVLYILMYMICLYIRNFYYQKLLDVRQKENDEIKKSQQKNKSKVAKPAFNPRFKR